MPIKSYLAHPMEGKKLELIKAISTIAQCDVIPAENREIIVVVTETETKEEEANLRQQLETIASLKLLAMVSGFNTPQKH